MASLTGSSPLPLRCPWQVTFATRPLAGGLGAGTYTMMDPTGGRSRRPRYSFQDLEPIYPVHKALKETAIKVSEKLKKRVSTAQVRLQASV